MRQAKREAPHLGMADAVRVADTIYVSGQVATDEHGQVVDAGDYGVQARTCFAKVERILAAFGADLCDVVEVTAFLAHREGAKPFLDARAAAFPVSPPATTTVVATLLREDFLVEVRAVAVVER